MFICYWCFRVAFGYNARDQGCEHNSRDKIVDFTASMKKWDYRHVRKSPYYERNRKMWLGI